MEHPHRASGGTSSPTAGGPLHLYDASTPRGPTSGSATHAGPSFAPQTSHPSDHVSSPVPSSSRSATSNGFGQPLSYATMTGHPSMSQEHFLVSDGSVHAAGLSPTHTSAAAAAAALSAQKRAYRQRRKDPSCDACRERKVKCDATDTSSCSECSSRGVRCQFTKETNRRMSSIKQVQDLEKQLSQAKQQISHLAGVLRDNGVPNLDQEPSSVRALHVSEPMADDRKRTTFKMEGLDETRRNIREFGCGIFQPPALYRKSSSRPPYPYVPTQTLPPKSIADRLISHYHGFVHGFAPLLHWPTFVEEYEELYRVGSFQESSRAWVALFYAVLACGTLMDPQPNGPISEAEGAHYMDASVRSHDIWSDTHTPDTARMALLASIYFMEVNLKTSAWIWLGAAVQISQDLGLHDEHGSYTSFELEMRRRISWSIYSWDRMISLEFGRPLLIDDVDCEVQEPTPVEDEYIRPTGIIAPPHGQNQPSDLVAVIPIVRITAQLRKSLKAQTIAPATLSTYDEHFRTIMGSFPEPFSIHSPAYLDPRSLMACCNMQSARFFLYRHNLTPSARPHDRRDALERCVSAAKDTARYIERSLQHGASSGVASYYSSAHMASWAARLRTMSSAFLCTHLWRCTLVSCLRLDLTTALTLVQASAAIGDLRRINIACGRYLCFFLEKLASRLHAGATVQSLETDEEMVAYASGDMQSRNIEAWIWVGREEDVRGTSGTGEKTSKSTTGSQTALSRSVSLSERQLQDWRGWDQIQQVLQHLLHDLQQQKQHQHQQQQQLHQHQQQQHVSMPANSPPTYGASTTANPMGLGHIRQTSFQGSGSHSLGQLAAPDQRNTSVSPGPASTRISIKDIM